MAKDNFFSVPTRSPFRAEFFYFDTPDYQADDIFSAHGVVPRFYEQYGQTGSDYVLIRCRIKRTEIHSFVTCMDELNRKMRLCGHPDYEPYCKAFMEEIDKGLSAEFDFNTISTTEYEHMKAQVENMTLYLHYIQEHYPEIHAELDDHFEGLPGYGEIECQQ